MSKQALHPALALFKELFDKAAQQDLPQQPTHFVPRSAFHAECKRRGIECPENIVEAWDWEERIGLPEFAHKILAMHHKARGTDFTPMEKGAWRLRQKQKRLSAKATGQTDAKEHS